VVPSGEISHSFYSTFIVTNSLQGFLDFPRDQDDLLEALQRYIGFLFDFQLGSTYPRRSKDLDMGPHLLGAIADMSADLTHLANTMRNVLHLALSVSPILLLVPKKFSSMAIRRDHLITVSLHVYMVPLIIYQ
jgi:hypothetical protein